jgi:hypothetical protein
LIDSKTNNADDFEIGLAATGNLNGVQGTSGILGLAYPSLTSGYEGTDVLGGFFGAPKAKYNTLFWNMALQNLSSPQFSLALKRQTGDGGYIAFGGLPPVNFSTPFVSTPLEAQKGKTNMTFYIVTPDALVFDGSNATQNDQYFIDSGAPFTMVPEGVAETVKKLFKPEARYVDGRYKVECNATAPEFGFKIGGKVFLMEPGDLIEQRSKNETSGLCNIGLQSWVSRPPYVLGAPFLQSVVAAFDVGASEMRFATHHY